MPSMLYLYVPDCDAAYAKAIAAGAKKLMEPMDQFYGERSGGVLDPLGNQWWFGTRNEEISSEELAKRMR
ncbi:MAG: VOC family protein [Limisphaerales bacterium]